MNLAVFVTGNGSNLQSIIDAIDRNHLTNVEISIVVSSNKNAYAINRAKKANIPVICSVDEYRIVEALKEFDINLIVLAGYLRKVKSILLNNYPDKIINIHPALLPKWGGSGMFGSRVHQSVLESGDKITGATTHWVDEKYDHGKIISQRKVEILGNDTVDSLSKRVLQVEHELLIDTLHKLEERFTKTGNFN